MGISKFWTPTSEEEEIIRRNSIDPSVMSVRSRDKDTIVLLNYDTRDEIWIRQGDKKWDTY